MPTWGGERWRIGGRRNHMKWITKLQKAPLPTSGKTVTGCSWVLQWNSHFPHYSDRKDSSVYGCAGQAGHAHHHHHPRGTNVEEWDWGITTKCELCISSPESDRWDYSRTSLKWVAVVSVLPPSLKQQGQNNFSPTMVDMLKHWKALLICSPWRPTMALVVPFP